ncbi:c-type cytochrome [Thalassovita aquimarina]|uniref:c-type cytochrome n=1 Tax=Thalassovita aquimarina TaxID=2785917 RepID=UPI0035648E22
MPVKLAKHLFAVLVFLCLGSAGATEEERQFRLRADPELERSGLMRFVLPRFTLKTGRRVELVTDQADMVFAVLPDGTPVVARGPRVFSARLDSDNSAAKRFYDWLLSDVGQATLLDFTPETGPRFAPVTVKGAVEEVVFEGDVALGAAVAGRHCTRCHRVSPEDRSTIGSTPSFMALRALPDWHERFTAFFALNPHPSFLRVEGVSPEFDPGRPPTITPVVVTPEEVDALLTYVSTVTPAYLGEEIRHQ